MAKTHHRCLFHRGFHSLVKQPLLKETRVWRYPGLFLSDEPCVSLWSLGITMINYPSLSHSPPGFSAFKPLTPWIKEGDFSSLTAVTQHRKEFRDLWKQSQAEFKTKSFNDRFSKWWAQLELTNITKQMSMHYTTTLHRQILWRAISSQGTAKTKVLWINLQKN